jgi:hypothetical protein
MTLLPFGQRQEVKKIYDPALELDLVGMDSLQLPANVWRAA